MTAHLASWQRKLRMLGLEHAKNTILNAQTHTQREGDRDLWGSARHLHPRVEERYLLMIYTRYKKIIISSLKNSHQKINPPQNGLHPLFIGRRRNPKTVLDRVQNHLWPDYRSTSRSTECAVDCPVDSAKSCNLAILTGFVDRPDGRPTNWVSFLSINFGRLSGRPIQTLCMSVSTEVLS